MRVRQLMQLKSDIKDELGIRFPTESKVIETTEKSRLMKGAILQIYGRQQVKDAWAAKVAVVHYWQGITKAPDALTEEMANHIRALPQKDLTLCLDELKYNDHYLLEVMVGLMEMGDLDTYDARNELIRLMEGKQPKLLTDSPAHMEKLKGFAARNIGPLEMNYVTNPLRLAVVEVLTHKKGLTPSQAIDIIMMKEGAELDLILEENGVKTPQDKVEFVEKNHHDHKAALIEAGGDVETAAISVVPVVPAATPVISAEPAVVAEPVKPVIVEPVKPVISEPVKPVEPTKPVITPTAAAPAQNDNVIAAPLATNNASFLAKAAPYVAFMGVMATVVYCCKNQIAGTLARYGIISNYAHGKKDRIGYGRPGEPSDDELDLEGEGHTLTGNGHRKSTPTSGRR
jgi:hypothetical protein